MENRQDQSERQDRPMRDRLAGAPISWGACEVPGWGPMPDPESVLTEMAELGLHGTELGPPGFLPADPMALAATLAAHALSLVGAFTTLVLHEADLTATARYARDTIDLLAAAGGEVLVVAAVQDASWSVPQPLDDEGWRRFAENAAEVQALATEHGLTFALHPHAGTVIETAAQVARAMAETDVGWCLDTGHLVMGGADPVQFAREHAQRVTHVHLKDVDEALATEVRDGRLTLLEATRQGLFLPLGRGDAGVAAVLHALDAHGYDGWLVLEQDTVIAADEPAADGGPTRDARESIALINTAQTEEINQ
jgi:inosose dehydratase